MANIKKIAAAGKKIKLAKPAEKESFLKKVVSHYGKSEGISYSKAQKEIREKQFYLLINDDSNSSESPITVPGMNFSCEYPPQESQLLDNSAQQEIQWRFSGNSAWISIPKSYFEPAQHEKLLSFYQELSQFKRQNTVEGVVFVFETDLLKNNSREELSTLSAKAQKQLILMNRNLGVTPPVYFLFDKSDTIEGFHNIFGDESGRWDEQILGAHIQPAERNKPLKELLNDKLTGVAEHIRMIELKMLVREKEGEQRRGVTKFTSEFSATHSTVSDFITQLLSPVNAQDLNNLGGFFFTATSENEKGERRSFFIKPIFQNLIPVAQGGVSHTKEKKKNFRAKTIAFSAASIVVLATFFSLIFAGSAKLNKWEKIIAQNLTRPITYDSQGMNNLRTLYDDYQSCKKFTEGKKTTLMTVLGYNPKPLSEAVRDHYYNALHTAITIPSEKTLYKKLSSAVIDGSSDLSNQFMPLKNSLRAYLACSSEGAQYPTLFDKDLLLAQLVPLTAKQFFTNTTPTDKEKETTTLVLTSYLELLQNGTLKSPYKPKENVVTKTQDRLVSLFDVKVVYETTIENLKKKGTNMFLFDLVPEANDVNMNSDTSLHEVYTPKAWQDYVSKEIQNASTRLNSVEKWVIGKNDNRMSGSFTNPDKLYRGMVSFYLDDTRQQWEDFVKSIQLYRFNSLYEASHVMLKLGSSSSAIGKTFEKFNGMTEEFKNLGGSEKEGDLFLAFADSLEIFHEVINNLDSYQAYMKKTGSAISDHRKKGTLCTVFKGDGNDPLYNLYNYVNKSMLPQLSKKEQDIVSNLLWQPYERTKRALSKPISTELNEIWKTEVYNPFKKHFTGKYPFSNSANNAEYATVMEFFSPTEGPVWKAYNSSLSGYITKYKGKYQTRHRNGMVPVTVSSKVLAFYDRADLIKRIFFYDNGKQKVWKFSITPTGKNKLKSAVISVGEISGDVMEVGALKYEWPEPKGSFILKFTDKHNNPAISQKYGEWTIMQEMNKNSLASTSQRFVNRFPAQFTVRAYAKQMSMRAEVVVSSPNHPFSYNPFNGLEVSSAFTK